MYARANNTLLSQKATPTQKISNKNYSNTSQNA